MSRNPYIFKRVSIARQAGIYNLKKLFQGTEDRKLLVCEQIPDLLPAQAENSDSPLVKMFAPSAKGAQKFMSANFSKSGEGTFPCRFLCWKKDVGLQFLS